MRRALILGVGAVAAVETYGLQPVAVALELERYMRRRSSTPRTVSSSINEVC